jgi:transketolase
MREAFVGTLLAEARKNPDIVLITGDLGYGVLEKFALELPEQFLNAGVAEQSMLGLASGIASTGKRVFVYSIGNFPTLRALEQIRNDVCYMMNPVVVVSVGAGYAYGSQGYTHHALEDIAVMRALPGLNVVSPSDPLETAHATKYLVADRRPAYLRLGRSGDGELTSGAEIALPGGVTAIAHGSSGSIAFTGSIGANAIAARKVLAQEGLDVGVYSTQYISDLSPETLSRLLEHGPLLTLEEHSYRGGFGSSILELASRHQITGRIKNLASSQNNLSQIGDQAFLREENGLGVKDIVSSFRSLMEGGAKLQSHP